MPDIMQSVQRYLEQTGHEVIDNNPKDCPFDTMLVATDEHDDIHFVNVTSTTSSHENPICVGAPSFR